MNAGAARRRLTGPDRTYGKWMRLARVATLPSHRSSESSSQNERHKTEEEMNWTASPVHQRAPAERKN
jgi:hypothetical protein